MKEKNNNRIIVTLAIVLSFISGTIGSYLVITSLNVIGKNIIRNVSQVEFTETSIADSVDKVIDAVVVVTAYQNGDEVSTGTGFVYKKSNEVGYILTNNHVVSDADTVKVIFEDNSEADATIVGSETYCDIAVLSVPVANVLDVAQIGNSEDMRVGDTVFTIGSPMGTDYSGTVTKGILSGRDRLVEVSFSGSTSDYYMKVLQTDAAINPGNSGGPLLNINGEVIGINSLKLVEDTIEGMGFAIPIEDAIYYANILETGATVKRPYLGISMLDITDTYNLWQSGVTIPTGVDEGIVIIEVEAGSPAEKGGLKKGDVVLSIGGEKTVTVAELRYELYKHEPGEKIELEYYRDGKENKTTITLVEKK